MSLELKPLVVVLCLCALAAACSSPRRNLVPVALPELTRLDPAVQKQVRDRYEALKAAMDNSSTPIVELALDYGQYGMVLQAAEFFDAAEPSYLNAQTLAPDEVRWPYYLASLYKSRGDTDMAEASYKRALSLAPDDVATLIWLGRLELDKGKTAEAEPLFAKAYSLAPNTVAVLAGMGRVSLDKHDYASAVTYLEQALTIDPEGESLHAPLAAAYRGLGQLDKARPHIGQWKNRDLPVPDPRQRDMDLLLESGLSYELRGIRQFEVQDWKGAAEFFRRGLALTPNNSPVRRSLQHKLGTALFLVGDVAGAERNFDAVIQAAPAGGIDEASAKAHYSLAVLLASNPKRVAEALPHFEASIKYQPNYIEAHLAMADFLRRRHQPDAALVQYRETLAINPRHQVARLGYAMCLVATKRYREAREWLEASVKQFPDRPELKIALARVLATSPDDRVRDGQQALTITHELFKGQRTTELGETIAMALAEYGDFTQAIAIQRDVMTAAKTAGMTAQLPHMEQNLALYERHQPCRTPWTDDDLVLGPSAAPAAPDQTISSAATPR
ncbi:MAG TPA: tetratricopeptide repeat protein [Vicinamibacterales bacterium]|nr:tetratricopeptide repeat protein [Vicinamibacterales bacterium]